MSTRFLSLCRAVLCLCPILLLGCGGEDDFFQQREAARFAQFVDEYFEGYFQNNPVLATEMGLHQYDDAIGPIDRDQIFGERSRLQEQLLALKKIDVRFLSQDDKFDYQILDYHIQGSLLQSNRVAYWARDHGYYDELICRSIDALIQDESLPLETRVRSIIARENLVPAILEGARDIVEIANINLAEIAVDQFESSLIYFQEFLPRAVEGLEDPALLAEFVAANDGVIAAYEDHLTFLRQDVLPDADIRPLLMGRQVFEEKVLFEEITQVSFDDLLASGEAELTRRQEALLQAANEIDDQGDLRAILGELANDRPADDGLFAAMEQAMDRAAQFISDQGLLTSPPGMAAKPREMPSYLRPVMLVSLSTPGLEEARPLDAYLRLSVPEAGWSQSQVDQLMRSYSSSALQMMAIHDGVPGRYALASRAKENPSKIRRFLQGSSFGDGWALYVEEMMLDQGFLDNDPSLRFEQQLRAVTAMARQVAGMKLHVAQLSFDEAVEFLMEEAYLEQPVAESEVRRAIRKPMSVLGSMARLTIVQLRDDAEEQGVSLKDFHDQLLRDSLPPGVHTLRVWSRPELRPPLAATGG